MSQWQLGFQAGADAAAYLGDGWSRMEEHGTWTDKTRATLTLPVIGDGRDLVCRIVLTPFTDPAVLPTQRVEVSVNGVALHRANLAEAATLEFAIPVSVMAGSGTFDMALHLPDATSPLSLGLSTDHRRLAIIVHELGLAPALVQGAAAPGRNDEPGRRVAAVTMVYNELEMLPLWLDHYARHVGAAHCFVVDHGSTDGSTREIGGANLVRLPRSPYDPHLQSKWNSEFCSSLLNFYDHVVYSDVDELVLPDPRAAATLREFCTADQPAALSAIGLNVIHRIDTEPPLDLSRPITAQRRFAFFCSPMCKPLLIREPVTWSPGSHSASAPVAFGDLYVFHLRWFDRAIGVRRLHRQRAMEWARLDAGAHARVPDEQFVAQMQGFGALCPTDDFDPASGILGAYLDRVVASARGREQDLYKIDLDIWPRELLRLPECFVGAF